MNLIYSSLLRNASLPRRMLFVSVLLIAVTFITLLVWQTGGIKYVYSHTMYIPIVLAGTLLGYRGGLLIALVGGVALGPWMPINTSTLEMQEPLNWMFRTCAFAAVGLLAGFSSDIGRRYVAHLRVIARRDPISKLPNRKALLEQLAKHMAQEDYRTQRRTPFLVTCNIDNSMALRSAFGFEVIDTIIKTYADNLTQLQQYSLEVYRTHATQLAVLVDDVGMSDIERLMQDCLTTITETVRYGGLNIYVSRHLSGVRLDASEQDPNETLKHAEIAIARANEKLTDSFIYTPEVGENISKQLALMAEVSNAIENNQLLMYYQPKVDLKSQQVIGAEALIRWHHPERGWIRPDEFIPDAEHSTLILRISEFVLRAVIQQVQQWQQQGITIPISINVTGHDLLQPGFSQMMFELLEEFQVDGSAIELEITEGTLIQDIDEVVSELLRLTRAKITVSIDDFGTGYSSLQYLYRLPISLLKIDQLFVKHLPEDQGASHICAAAVALAQKMGIKALAEGVETQQNLDYLVELGCDYGQGYFFSKPLSADAFAAWYHHRETQYEQPLG